MIKRSEIAAPFRSLTRPEREVIFGSSDADNQIQVYVASPVWYRKLVAQGWRETSHNEFGAFFVLPKNALIIRGAKAALTKRTPSPAQNNARLRAIAAKKRIATRIVDTDSDSAGSERSESHEPSAASPAQTMTLRQKSARSEKS